jgi:hypothetical protein
MSPNWARGRAAEAQARSLFVEPEAVGDRGRLAATAASPPTRTTAGWPFTARPPLGRAVAEPIPNARFEVMEQEGPPALPGDPGPVERPRRRLLAPARDAGLSPLGSIATGAIGHPSADESAARPPETTPRGWPVRVTERTQHAVLCASHEAGPSHARRHLRQAGRNVPFDPLCVATSYAAGSGRLTGTPKKPEEPAEPG